MYKGRNFNKKFSNLGGYKLGYSDGVRKQSSLLILPRDPMTPYEDYYMVGKEDGEKDRASYQNLLDLQK